MRSPRVALAAMTACALLVSCAGRSEKASFPFKDVQQTVSWAPAPAKHGGLSSIAEQAGRRLLLHTAHGDVDFWAGVNLGSTTPGHSPGELAMSRADYIRWFNLMGRAGVRVVRIYTIHPPAMYEELKHYNEAHPAAPLYLSQGIYLPDESYLQTKNLYSKAPTNAMIQELKDASDAVHGDLSRHGLRGRANGTWTADVSPWTASWIVGVEWDPIATLATDKANAAAPGHRGRYFSSTADASPTERWIAARMDELATHEAARGCSVPIAMVNWPTADPLRHPAEPLPREDLVGVDANHVTPSKAWPGGTFASYHAYPYYPDFLRHETDLRIGYGGRIDAYAGYLKALQAHHASMPMMVSEFGVPSSIGAAHFGTNGRDQGAHSEATAMAMDGDMLRMFKNLGLAGGLLFAWTDEWFKFTWNTLPRQEPVDSERRALWHDPLTNEQWFGFLAEDPVRVGRRVPYESRGAVREVGVDHDASWVYLDITLDKEPTAPVRVGFDVVPGGLALPGTTGTGDNDYAVVYDPVANQATALVRGEIDPVLVDGLPPESLPKPGPDGWSLQRLTTNRALVLPTTGKEAPAEFQEIGRLRTGSWDPTDLRYDSRSTVRRDGNVLHLRLPWSMIGLADPSSKTALVPEGGIPRGVPVAQIGLVVDVGHGPVPTGSVSWEPWQQVEHTERVKAGAQAFVDALVATSR